MKARILAAILCLTAACSVSAQVQRFYPYQPPPPPTPEEVTKSKMYLARNAYIPTDPWREIGGMKYYAKGSNWVQFVGKILEVQPGKGIRVKGWYGPPMTWPTVSERFKETWQREGGMVVPVVYDDFFVANCPLRGVEGDLIFWEQKYSAREDGFYSYNTVGGGSRSLRRLEYGAVTTPPPRFADLSINAEFYFATDTVELFTWVKISPSTASNTLNQKVTAVAPGALVKNK